MARAISTDVLVTALLFTMCGSAALACSSSAGPRGESPAGESNGNDHDAAGSGGADGTGGRGSAPDAGSGGGMTAPADAASPADARAAEEGSVPADAARVPPLACTGAGSRFATGSPSHEFGPGQNVGQEHFPEWVLGPPQGGGECQGATTNVVSLGNGGTVTLEFAGNAIVDEPGPDFIVFENAFGVNCDTSNVFAELATVSVSDDGIAWTDFPCTATQAPYGECAGSHVVYANAETNTIDPTDPSVGGGDPFDLADIGVARARFVRVTDRVDLNGTSGVFDLDAVSIVHPFCR